MGFCHVIFIAQRNAGKSVAAQQQVSAGKLREEQRGEQMADREGMLLTLEELREFDGRSGRPVYVAYRGEIYDVSESPLWETGKHQGLHSAGSDLTEEIVNAPHAEEVLMRFPVVGEIKQEDPSGRTLAD